MSLNKINSALNLPLVSLVVTNYNYGKYMEDCLTSILHQSYRPIECIIIDDNSSDNSIDIAEKFLKENTNTDISFRIIKRDTNQGQLAGFITGIKESKGVFIGFIDADDFIMPEFINIHLQTHFRTNVAMTSSQQIEFDEYNQVHSLYSVASPQITGQGEGQFTAKEFNNLKAFLDNQIFFEEKINYKVINIDSHKFGGWYWSPTSNVILRKKAIENFIFANNTDHWKYCADKFLFNFAHLIGGSCIIYSPLTAYRRHYNNGFTSGAIAGNVQYFSQKIWEKIDVNNKAVIRDTLALMVLGKNNFINFLGKDAFTRMVKNIIKDLNKEKIGNYTELIEQLLSQNEYEKIMN
ncbi:MAG: glycosyltransferase family 2 protein [Candidatus Gastranaerophilales bacterium]|nr:glycosyltransferase family 2 protein [Candidatus Gastranaerophilales bacterium]